jgi:putative peptide zinc metalloprotease protein
VRLLGFLIAWITIGFHEIGHGVACKRYGGQPTQIGLMWRFPFVAFYCKVDDVVAFDRRSHRVATAFAGIYVNLACLVPAGLLWQWGPGSSWLHSLTSVLLLFGTATVTVNLLPVLHLDGYHMLEHATSTYQLQWESARFAGAVLRHGRAGLSGYPPRVRWIYAGYAVLCAAILGTGLFFLLRLWYSTLAGLWGRPAAALLLLAEAVLIAAFLRRAVRHRSRRSAKA